MARRKKKRTAGRGHFRIDPVSHKKETGRPRHTTGAGGGREGFGEWDYGQFPHCFKLTTTAQKQPSGDPYWRWECRKGCKGNAVATRRGALRSGTRHSKEANRRGISQVPREHAPQATWDDKDLEALGRLRDRKAEKDAPEASAPANPTKKTASRRATADTPEERLHQMEIAAEAEKKREKRPRPPRQR